MIIPSIDLIDGQVVQLRQGKERVLTDERDPVELAREFNRYGEVAVVDLDAATGNNPNGPNVDVIKHICRVADVRVGGGIRDAQRAEMYLRAGARQVMIGTAATPELLKELPKHRVLVALDHNNGKVVDQGWANDTGETVQARAERLAPYCGGFLCTFVATEGTLSGMDLAAIEQLRSDLSLPVTVAGGVATTEEATAIAKLGVDVQVGMALYTGKLDLTEAVVNALDWDKSPDGLLPTVVQSATNGEVLMLAYSNRDSLTQALTSGKGVYYSRSRQALWEKGASSGNIQALTAMRVDCDRDSLLFTVEQSGSACHTESHSCFGQGFRGQRFTLGRLFEVIKQRQATMPEGSYTARLFNDRPYLLKKLMEEAFEVATAPDNDNLVWELGDLLYFASTLAVAEGIDLARIEAELSGRE